MSLDAYQNEVPIPADDWMVVLIRKQLTVAEGRLVVPESAFDEMPTVEVLAVGPGMRSPYSGNPIPMDVMPGDVIHCIAHFMLIGKYREPKKPEEEKLIEVPQRLGLVGLDGQPVKPPETKPKPEEEPEEEPKLAYLQRRSVVGWKYKAPRPEVTNG